MTAKTVRTGVFCVLGTLLASTAFAKESWLAIPTAATNVLFSVDEASLVRSGDMVKFWERLVYVVPEHRDEVTGKMVKEKRVYRVMNCLDKTQAYLHAAQIGEDSRRIEESHNNEDKLAMTAIRPGSVAEEELIWACGLGKNDFQASGDS